MRILEVGRRAGISKVAYGREGRQLIAAAEGCYIVWSLETFEQLAVIGRGRVISVDCLFVPGGKAYLEAHGDWTAVEELPEPTRLRAWHLEEIRDLTPLTGFLCFAPDGRSFLRESYGLPWQSPQRIAMWDFAGACVRTYPQAGAWSPTLAAFSPDGTVLALDAGTYTTTLWDAVSREPTVELVHTDRVFDLAFSPAGRRLATSAGRTVRVWSVPEGKCLHKFRAFRAYTECVALSPDGALLVAGSREGRVRTWDVESGRELSDHDWRQGEVSDVAFSPDGQTAAAACRKAVVVWDVDF